MYQWVQVAKRTCTYSVYTYILTRLYQKEQILVIVQKYTSITVHMLHEEQHTYPVHQTGILPYAERRTLSMHM